MYQKVKIIRDGLITELTIEYEKMNEERCKIYKEKIAWQKEKDRIAEI